MKKLVFLALILVLLTGCGASSEDTAPLAQLANPWAEHESLSAAEEAVGFSLSIPETVEGSYQAESFRVMNGLLLEVTYRDRDFEVTVRKMSGEGQDISGDYRDYETLSVTELDDRTITNKLLEDSWLTLISYDGYSYSLYAPNGYWGDSHGGFLNHIFGE